MLGTLDVVKALRLYDDKVCTQMEALHFAMMCLMGQVSIVCYRALIDCNTVHCIKAKGCHGHIS